MTKISVIIPIHNTAEYLPACLEAVLTQTLSDIEVICVDDGSADDSAVAAYRYAARDARVRVIELGRNHGVSTARNIGLEAATGEYTAFVDSDDVVKPDFCQRLYAAARRADADIAKGNYAYREHCRIDYGINRKIREDKAGFYIQCSSAIYRTAFLRAHNLCFLPHLTASEDLVFAFGAAIRANAVAIDDEAHILITTRPGSASFGAPDHKTIIDHYRALGVIVRAAQSAGISTASFNYVTASLFALFARIAARNRQVKVRRFVVTQNARLFGLVKAHPQWDADLFKSALPPDDLSLYEALEENTLHRFFTALDALRARRCRLAMRNSA